MKDVDITDQGWDSSNNDIIGRRGRGRSWGREGWGVPVGEQAYQPQRNSEGFQKAQRICIISCVYWIFPFSYFGFWWQISPDSQWKTYMTHTHTHTYLHTLTHTKDVCFLQQKIQYRSFTKETKKERKFLLDTNGEPMGACVSSSCLISITARIALRFSVSNQKSKISI